MSNDFSDHIAFMTITGQNHNRYELYSTPSTALASGLGY